MLGSLCALQRGRGLVAALGISLAGCLVASAGRCDSLFSGEAKPEKLAEQYVDDQIKLFRAEAELKFVNEILSSGSAEAAANPKEPLPEVNLLLQKSVDDLNQRASKLYANEVDPDEGRLRNDWVKLRTQRNLLDLQRAAVVSNQPVDIGKALVGSDSWVFWFFGTLAVGVLAFVSWHDRRHEYRRALNGSKARSYGLTRILKWTACLLVLVLLTAVFAGKRIAGLFGKDVPGDVVRTTDVMADENKEIEGRLTEAEDRLKDAKHRLGAKREELLAVVPPALRPSWEKLLETATTLRSDAKAAVQTMGEVGKEKEEVGSLKDFLEKNRSKVASLNRWKWAINGGVGIALSSLTVALGLALLHSIKTRQYRTKHTCPMCLGYETMKVDPSHGGKGIPELRMVKCNGEINDEHGEAISCPFESEPFYQSMDKLCFPTLGTRGAGKTHWLAMVYHKLLTGRYQDDVQFQKVETKTAKEFDQLLRQIFKLHIGPTASQSAQLPYPLIFNFRDNDWWGNSHLLLNIFNYHGEITHGDLATRSNAHRRRAHCAHKGYFFFLDPTRPREEQEEALDLFRTDVQVLSGSASHSLRSPVALCISKIDLLCRDFPDPSFLRQFYDRLQQIDPSGLGISSEDHRAAFRA